VPSLLMWGLGVCLFGCSSPVPTAGPNHPPHTSLSDVGSPPSTREMASPFIDTLTTGPPPISSPLATEILLMYERRYEAYWECLRAPAICDESYLWPSGPAALQMAAVRSEMLARDRHIGSEPVGYHKVEQIRISADQRSAEVISCWWSTAVLYGAPIQPDLPVSPHNPLTLVASTPEGGRQSDRFVFHEGSWLLISSTALDAGFAEDPCTG
jgi:hypothetical protein